jgi:hypothetical protein
MAFDVRYNLKHIGDIFVDVVQKTAGTATQCSKRLFLAYDIRSLHCKRDQLSRSFGERVEALMKEGESDFTKDAKLAEIIVKLNVIEKDIAGFEEVRNNLVFPFSVKQKHCGCNCDSATNFKEKGVTT